MTEPVLYYSLPHPLLTHLKGEVAEASLKAKELSLNVTTHPYKFIGIV